MTPERIEELRQIGLWGELSGSELDELLASQERVTELQVAVTSLISAMRMQLQREKGHFHIPSYTARYIWAEAIRKGRKALETDAP